MFFKNRMFSAPMGGTDITADCTIGPKSTAFYELRAKGGAGAVTVSECMVHPETDGSHAYHLDLKIVEDKDYHLLFTPKGYYGPITKEDTKMVMDAIQYVGYKDVDYFVNRFIAVKGCTPAKFRKQSVHNT